MTATQTLREKEQNIKTLIDMGINGHFPLFHQEWLDDYFNSEACIETKSQKLNRKEKSRAQKIIQRLSKHRELERKRIILHSLNREERVLFIRAFFDMVENKILDRQPEIH